MELARAIADHRAFRQAGKGARHRVGAVVIDDNEPVALPGQEAHRQRRQDCSRQIYAARHVQLVIAAARGVAVQLDGQAAIGAKAEIARIKFAGTGSRSDGAVVRNRPHRAVAAERGARPHEGRPGGDTVDHQLAAKHLDIPGGEIGVAVHDECAPSRLAQRIAGGIPDARHRSVKDAGAAALHDHQVASRPKVHGSGAAQGANQRGIRAALEQTAGINKDLRRGRDLVDVSQPYGRSADDAAANLQIPRYGFHAAGLIQDQGAVIHARDAGVGVGERAGEDVGARAALGQTSGAADGAVNLKGAGSIDVDNAVAGVGNHTRPDAAPVAGGQSPPKTAHAPTRAIQDQRFGGEGHVAPDMQRAATVDGDRSIGVAQRVGIPTGKQALVDRDRAGEAVGGAQAHRAGSRLGQTVNAANRGANSQIVKRRMPGIGDDQCLHQRCVPLDGGHLGIGPHGQRVAQVNGARPGRKRSPFQRERDGGIMKTIQVQHSRAVDGDRLPEGPKLIVPPAADGVRANAISDDQTGRGNRPRWNGLVEFKLPFIDRGDPGVGVGGGAGQDQRARTPFAKPSRAGDRAVDFQQAVGRHINLRVAAQAYRPGPNAAARPRRDH